MPPPTPRDATAGSKAGRALRHAAYVGDVAGLMQCVAEGADINEPNRQGRTALAYACEAGHLNIVCTLIESGVNVNVECDDGHTALHYAAREGQEDIVRQLLKSGAHPNAACYYTGGTSMHEAALKGKCGVIRL
eukprot:SAG31_NODE_20993_length_560_cov_0.859002_1_plen_133_part_10